MTNPNSYLCAFCGKRRSDVISFVASTLEGFGICNECVMMAADLIIKQHRGISAKNRELRWKLGELQAHHTGETLLNPTVIMNMSLQDVLAKLVDELRALVPRTQDVPPTAESVITSPAPEEKQDHGEEADEAGRGGEGTSS